MSRKTIPNHDVKALNEKLKSIFNIDEFFSKKDRVEVIEPKGSEKEKILLKNGEPTFVEKEGTVIPELHFILKKNILKKITIDMLAIKFIINGADIMRPGIVAADETIKEGEIVVIIDQKNQKPLAIGKALVSSETLKTMDKGKAVKNLHYAGDEVWLTTSAL